MAAAGLGYAVFGPRRARAVPAGRVVIDYWEKWTGQEAQAMRRVVEAFNQGWQVEVGPMMKAGDYLDGLDEIPGLREAAEALAGGDAPARLASAVEFLLEGLHLSNKLNKVEEDGRILYR